MTRTHPVPYPAAVRSVALKLAEERLDFVARVNTPWTMLGLEVWLARHASKETTGVVIGMPSAIGGETEFPASTLAFLERYPRIATIPTGGFDDLTRRRAQHFRRALATPRLLRRLGAPRGQRLDIVCPRRPDYTLLADLGPAGFEDRTIHFHLLDEGFGGVPAAGWGGWGYRLESMMHGALRRISAAPALQHGLLEPDAIPPRVRTDLAADYRQAIGRLAAATRVPSSTRPVALVLTSYLSRVGRMPAAQEIRLLDELLTFVDALGYQIWLKLHPRDSIRRYEHLPSIGRAQDIIVLPSAVSAEAFLGAMHPGRDAVVGLISNVHFTARHLYGLDVYLLPSRAYGGGFDVAESAYGRLFPGGLPTISSLPARIARPGDAIL